MLPENITSILNQQQHVARSSFPLCSSSSLHRQPLRPDSWELNTHSYLCLLSLPQPWVFISTPSHRILLQYYCKEPRQRGTKVSRDTMHLEYLQGFCLTQSAVLYISFTIQIHDPMTTKCRQTLNFDKFFRKRLLFNATPASCWWISGHYQTLTLVCHRPSASCNICAHSCLHSH